MFSVENVIVAVKSVVRNCFVFCSFYSFPSVFVFQALDLQMVSLFDARELELVIAGTADIDVKDWRANTDYRSGKYFIHLTVGFPKDAQW